jgi:uncharacterized protein (DUF305 family)
MYGMYEIEREGLGAPTEAADAAGHDADRTDAEPAGSPATEAYRAANIGMREATDDIACSNDPDVDFARGMISHRQGAIDMARLTLEHGEDLVLRQLAKEVIEAQEAEIELLRDWLAQREE